VQATGVNPVDAGNRTDGRWARLQVPCILGYDIAGVVDSVGMGVTGLARGDRVMAMTHFPDGAGGVRRSRGDRCSPSRADYLRNLVHRRGSHATRAGTASLVLSRLALPATGRMLVLGASGGVGLFLLQLATAARITTIATGREAMHDQMIGLGAAACIGYTREDVAARTLTLAAVLWTPSPTWLAERWQPLRSRRYRGHGYRLTAQSRWVRASTAMVAKEVGGLLGGIHACIM
jgi:NADPH:quinone reductase